MCLWYHDDAANGDDEVEAPSQEESCEKKIVCKVLSVAFSLVCF